MKITPITAQMVISKVISTSCTEARMFWVRSTRMLTETDGGIAALSFGSAALMRSTVAITFAPGCLVMNSTIPRPSRMVLSAGAAAPA